MIPAATAGAPWSLRRWLRYAFCPPTPLRPSFTTWQWHRPLGWDRGGNAVATSASEDPT